MPLDATQLVTVAEITLETYSVVEEYAELLNDEQITAIGEDIDLWANLRDSHVKLKGGADGVDFDNERARNAIRQRVRKSLGRPLYSTEVIGESGSYAVANVPVF